MKPGERPEQSIARLVKRELHLDIDTARFRPLGCHSYSWARRQQPPMDNGTCDISVVLTLVLLPGEADRIHMDKKEYAEFRYSVLSQQNDSTFKRHCKDVTGMFTVNLS